MVPLNYPKLEDFNIDIFDISGFRVQHSKNLLFNIYTGLYRYSVYIYIYTSIHNKDHLYGTCLVIIGTMYVYIYIYKPYMFSTHEYLSKMVLHCFEMLEDLAEESHCPLGAFQHIFIGSSGLEWHGNR